jgi:hypothetical protein
MKILWDKLSKTGIYLAPILMVVTISLSGDANLPKTITNTQPTTIEVATNVQTEEIGTNQEEERLAPMIQKKQTSLSRGGGVGLKQPTQRDIINNYVKEISAKYKVDPWVIMSMIQTESEYNPNAKNGNCLGLMQISSYWHRDRARQLGVTNFYDPYSNILLGVDYISELINQYGDIRLVLMLYNMDHNTALRMYKNGQITDYARTILARAEQYKKGE